MHILIVETRHCHTEIFPTWSHLLQDESLTFWQSNKSAKLNVSPLLTETSAPQQITSLSPPLSWTAHFRKIKRLKPDVIILNSAEVSSHSKVDAHSLHEITGVPVIALCHRKETYEAIHTKRHPQVAALTLSPRLSDPAHCISAVHYTNHVTPPPSLQQGLKLIVPGSIAWDRRHYPYIKDIEAKLQEKDSITILGSCSSQYKVQLRELLKSTTKVKHQSNAKPFPEFIKAIQQSHAILPLIEPAMPRFNEYRNSLISGTINLAIGLHRPVLAHQKFLASSPEICDASQGYTEQSLGHAIELLRSNYKSISSHLKTLHTSVLDQSKTNLHQVLERVTARV